MCNPLYPVEPNQHSGCSRKPWLRVRWRSDQPPGSEGKQLYLADMFARKQNVPASFRVKAGEISIFGYSRLHSRWRGLGMKMRLLWFVLALTLWSVRSTFISGQEKPLDVHPRNIVVFVFDGMRAGSVNAVDTPTMFWIRNHGVNFVNSHSLAFSDFYYRQRLRHRHGSLPR